MVLKGEEDMASQYDGHNPRVKNSHSIMVLSSYGTTEVMEICWSAQRPNFVQSM